MSMPSETIERLSELFGNYKAEYLQEKIFDLFTKPAYFPELETGRPCVLVGGRGTGKTTVLRSLSYEGRYALNKDTSEDVSSWPYYGFYMRVDTNRVTAFSGPDLPDKTWAKLFAHYMNMLLCSQAFRFLRWYKDLLPSSESLSAESCRLIAVSLRLESCRNIDELISSLNGARIQFEAYLNNLNPDSLPPLSLQGAPIELLVEQLGVIPQFAGKRFFFLLDEYENFLDYQQVVVNTLIKHSGGPHTFKVGVRELGWRARHTSNVNERLTSPADYALITIAEKLDDTRFENFASEILNQRMSYLGVSLGGQVASIQDMLPGLSPEEEAELLGVQAKNKDELSRLGLRGKSLPTELSSIPPLELYYLLSGCSSAIELHEKLESRADDSQKWSVSYNNYKHALLFTIKEKKSGLRKYYTGWETFVSLSGRNIRYLIELVDQTLIAHANESVDLSTLNKPVSYETQTRSASNVGRKNVSELEGLSVRGAQLAKLVLGFGRVFQVMAQDAINHTPEANQFHFPGSGEIPEEVVEILQAGVMHLALVRSTGNKLLRDEIKEYDYSLHPIFAPFFVFSHRKKRKILVTPHQISALITKPTIAIRDILAKQHRSDDSPVPDQLALFGGYYESNS
ncbi:hypothetical protein CFIICLFH_3373 [Methylobacterium goesingense]|nr:hypothetical protein CFIICLFH_3373 [Methylobacterium goesingense]